LNRNVFNICNDVTALVTCVCYCLNFVVNGSTPDPSLCHSVSKDMVSKRLRRFTVTTMSAGVTVAKS